MRKTYIQDSMPDNVCFGCGTQNPHGLQIKSFAEGDEYVCIWQSQEKYHGWQNVINGGILATLIDCHTMGAAVADAYEQEDRPWGSEPVYRYATGTINVKYLAPTLNDVPIELRARIIERSDRKTRVHCDVYSRGTKTAEADVTAIRVREGDLKANEAFR